jgi:hypothetical protein
MIAEKAMNSVITQPKARRNTPLPNIIKTADLGAQAIMPIDNRLNNAPQVRNATALLRYINFLLYNQAADCN